VFIENYYKTENNFDLNITQNSIFESSYTKWILESEFKENTYKFGNGKYKINCTDNLNKPIFELVCNLKSTFSDEFGYLIRGFYQQNSK
jgi:hypothetical protein